MDVIDFYIESSKSLIEKENFEYNVSSYRGDNVLLDKSNKEYIYKDLITGEEYSINTNDPICSKGFYVTENGIVFRSNDDLLRFLYKGQMKLVTYLNKNDNFIVCDNGDYIILKRYEEDEIQVINLLNNQTTKVPGNIDMSNMYIKENGDVVYIDNNKAIMIYEGELYELASSCKGISYLKFDISNNENYIYENEDGMLILNKDGQNYEIAKDVYEYEINNGYVTYKTKKNDIYLYKDGVTKKISNIDMASNVHIKHVRKNGDVLYSKDRCDCLMYSFDGHPNTTFLIRNNEENDVYYLYDTDMKLNLKSDKLQGIGFNRLYEIDCYRNLMEDLNFDGKIDILDLSYIASRYNEKVCYLEELNLNSDDYIDIYDLVLIAKKMK